MNPELAVHHDETESGTKNIARSLEIHVLSLCVQACGRLRALSFGKYSKRMRLALTAVAWFFAYPIMLCIVMFRVTPCLGVSCPCAAVDLDVFGVEHQ